MDAVAPMISITKEEYDRLKLLEFTERRVIVQRSMTDVLTLEDDIDKPIRNIVAMINLLGCRTIWSCCGFDYAGQPEHKFHEYGAIYIRIMFSNAAYSLGYNLMRCRLPLPWMVTAYQTGGAVETQLKAQFAPAEHLRMWDNVICPHYSESAAFAIHNLEQILSSFRENFTDEVVINDTNKEFRESFENWQYAPKTSWTIRKKDILERFPVEQTKVAQ